MNRDWNRINKYYSELLFDIYPQEMDEKHYAEMVEAIEVIPKKTSSVSSILDVGCGRGDAQHLFESLGYKYMGMSLGEDSGIGYSRGNAVLNDDFHFIDFEDDTFDLIFARHVLEHSPMPLLALMEWHRVSKKYLYLIFPNPEYWSWFGRNHYYVLNRQQLRWILRRAGWEIIYRKYTEKEFRLLCIKRPRVGYEGYLQSPLPATIYERERDDK